VELALLEALLAHELSLSLASELLIDEVRTTDPSWSSSDLEKSS
jgi:hypothetical protein